MLRHLLRSFSLALLAILIFAIAWGAMEYHRFTTAPLNTGGGGMSYEVAPGMTLKKIAQDLQQRGVLAHASYLVWFSYLQNKGRSIRAGEYTLAPGTTPSQLLDYLASGKVTEYSLTLVEGWTFRQVMDAIGGHEKLHHTLTGLDERAIMAKLGFAGQPAEGRFYPDTYRFPKGTTDVAFLQRAHRAMDQHLQQEWRNRSTDSPLRTPDEALTLASIVEKETGLASERPLIAGVFVRRLRIGMPLQTDPTVIYGLGEAFDGNLRRRDLESDTPYNTYMHTGLPPAPIAMPSADAIHAALHPAPGDALYFVARGDGGHVFSASLEQHNRAVFKYQLGGTQRATEAQQ